MPIYSVLTPEYEMYSATSYEPAEYGRDYIEVEADSRHDAMIVAVRIWRSKGERSYIRWYCDECPFTKLEVHELCE